MSWTKIACSSLALSVALIGCDDVKKAAEEAEQAATANAESAEGAEESEKNEAEQDGPCTIESIPFEAGAPGSGRVAFPVSSAPKGKQQKIFDGGVGVISLDSAEWVYRDVTPKVLEKQIRLSANGKFVGYLVVDRGGRFGGPVKDVFVEVVDLGSKKKKQYQMPKGSSDGLVYGVTDAGQPVLRFTATGKDKKLEMRTGMFEASGEFDSWHTEPGRFTRGYHGLLTRDGGAVIAVKKVNDKKTGVVRYEKGSKPKVIYESEDGVSLLASAEMSASADGSKIAILANFSDGKTRKQGTLALDVASGKSYRHLNFINARLSPDGKTMIGKDPSEMKLLWAVVARTFSKPKNGKIYQDVAQAIRWAPSSDRIIASARVSNRSVLSSLDTDSGDSVPISQCHHFAGYGVAWSGK